MPPTESALSDRELERLLHEDAPYGDLTTSALTIGERLGRITFHVRDPMVICGVEEATRLFTLAGAVAERHASSGERAASGTPLLSARGPASGLFRVWKVAQALIESASGVASAAREIVERAEGKVVACTRKHFPGIKPMMVKAVRAGGATMHRLGLSESVMVTAEHRAFLDAGELSGYTATLRHAQPEKRCLVEVDTAEAALALIGEGCEAIQLEKLRPEQVAVVVAAARARAQATVVAAAGGIHAGNAADYAAAGADVLVTSAPYFAKPRDVQVRFERLG
ncbi:ModD protein [Endothiovibrio diazotrophicus]